MSSQLYTPASTNSHNSATVYNNSASYLEAFPYLTLDRFDLPTQALPEQQSFCLWPYSCEAVDRDLLLQLTIVLTTVVLAALFPREILSKLTAMIAFKFLATE